jgi:hypothetical protein
MKSIVFAKFLDVIEDEFGLEIVDKVMFKSHLESDCICTAIVTYRFSKIVRLL